MLLENKVALITGAGSGFGKATSLLFASEGARVAVVDIDKNAAEAVVKEITDKGGAAIAIAANDRRTTMFGLPLKRPLLNLVNSTSFSIMRAFTVMVTPSRRAYRTGTPRLRSIFPVFSMGLSTRLST